MEVGFSSYAVGWSVGIPGSTPATQLDAIGVVFRAAALGFRRVQLADNVPLHTLSPEAWSRLRSVARQHQIALEVGTRGLTVDNVERYIALATEAGSEFCRIVIDLPGYEPNGPEVVRLLRELCPRLAAREVVLAIENHDRFGAEQLADIIAQADSPWIGVCLDTANSLGAAEGLETVAAVLGKHTVNVHLKDFVIRRAPHFFGFVIEGAPLGAGRLTEAGVKRMLAQMPRCWSVTLEHWVPPAENIAATVALEAAWCRQSAATLRKWWPTALRSMPS